MGDSRWPGSQPTGVNLTLVGLVSGRRELARARDLIQPARPAPLSLCFTLSLAHLTRRRRHTLHRVCAAGTAPYRDADAPCSGSPGPSGHPSPPPSPLQLLRPGALLQLLRCIRALPWPCRLSGRRPCPNASPTGAAPRRVATSPLGPRPSAGRRQPGPSPCTSPAGRRLLRRPLPPAIAPAPAPPRVLLRLEITK